MFDSDSLISPTSSLDSLLIAGVDKNFDFYVHNEEGYYDVATGTNLQQQIYTLKPSLSILSHAYSQLSKISSRIDIQFTQVFSSDLADISLYFDTGIEIDNTGGLTLGLTVFYYDPESDRRWIDIYFNSPSLNNYSTELQAYVFNHEFLHALGLEHPFDNSDGDFYLSIDPEFSATPEQTVMSYRTPVDGLYPTDLTINDYAALEIIWGSPLSGEYIDNKQDIYRLFQPSTGKHLYSSSLVEIDILTGLRTGDFYLNEGIAYSVAAGANQELYRFFHPNTGRHLYSANINEKNKLLSDLDSGYIFEGVAFHVFNSQTISSSRTEVFRYYDPSTSSHFYSANPVEQVLLETSHPHWINEGIAWYA